MPLTFYPHSDDVQKGSTLERIDIMMDAAERYKAIISDLAKGDNAEVKKITAPKDQIAAFNWEELSRILREIRDAPEINKSDKERKAELLNRLAEVYEVLRAAKMPKLEAVRLALMSEANQLRGNSTQVA